MVKRILIIGPSWVGDIVMMQALFQWLKMQDSACVIDVMGTAGSFPILQRMPEVNQTLPLPFKHGEQAFKKRWAIGKSLRASHYDQAIVLPNSFKSAMIPWAAHIPKRTGWLGEMRWGLLNDVRILNKKKYPLMIERFIALGLKSGAALPKKYPIPSLIYSDVDRQHALKKFNLDIAKPILALCPGAAFGSAKRWPPRYFAAVAAQKIKEGWTVWILGSSAETPLAKTIIHSAGEGAIDLTSTDLSEAIDLLSLAAVVVSNDSGLMHVAAALKRPLIAIYGPTSPDFTPPLHDVAKILQLELECQPCFQRDCPLQHHYCMNQLGPERVLHAIHELNTTCAS